MPDERDLEELTQAACRGDREALATLLERSLPELHAFVRLRAGPALRARESAADIVQSVCREVLEHADRFRHPGQSAFKRWLFRTAVRKILARRESQLAQKREVGREEALARAGSPEEDARLFACYQRFSSPSHGVALREEIERVERAFDQLSPEHREVVTLAHLAGLSRAEIAAEMGRSEGAVRVLLHRALARLSDLLGGAEDAAAAT